MSSDPTTVPSATPVPLRDIVTPAGSTPGSRVLARAGGSTVTLLAFEAGQGIREHTTPVDVLAIVCEGTVDFRIGSTPVEADAQTVLRLPAGVPHELTARTAARLLLVLLREPAASPAPAG